MQTKRNPHKVFRLAYASQFVSVSVRLLNTALFDMAHTQPNPIVKSKEPHFTYRKLPELVRRLVPP